MAGGSYRRVLLKLSGEALMGDAPYGIDTETVSRIGRQIGAAQELGVEIAIVVGGGNIFRGAVATTEGLDHRRQQAEDLLLVLEHHRLRHSDV
jgi:uridylate kinase